MVDLPRFKNLLLFYTSGKAWVEQDIYQFINWILVEGIQNSVVSHALE